MRRLIAISFLLWHCVTAQANDSEFARLQYADGTTQTARLLETDSDGQLQFEFAVDTPQTSSRDRVFQWGQLTKQPNRPQIVFQRGGYLVFDASEFERMDKNAISLRHSIFGSLAIPTRYVQAIRFQPAATDRKLASWLQQVADRTELSDEIRLTNGDKLDGTWTQWQDDMLTIEVAGQSISISADRIAQLQLGQRSIGDKPLPETKFWIGLNDGSLLPADSVELNARSLEVSVLGSQWKADSFFRPLDMRLVRFIELANTQHLVHVADLPIVDFRHTPFLGQTMPLGRNRNSQQLGIQVNGIAFRHGLGMRPTSRCVVDVPEGTAWFVSEMAIDDVATQNGMKHGSVRFRVFVEDRDKRWSEAFRSEVVRGDTISTCRIKVAPANRLALVVDWADRAIEGDEAVWLNPRFLQTPAVSP
ncbi:MAG: NPCBM/NEW2 domain-containing protein [Planctomycetales bacterium]|nr:NPCBM/NEW2 domain-containing protein [Planctomycetales bacterium]